MSSQPLLCRVGEALYGPRWQRDMARTLGVNERTCQRWARGQDNPRPGVYADLQPIVRERRAELAELDRELNRAARVSHGTLTDTNR